MTAESCTGGLVSAVITSVAGSSEILDRGFVSYSNKSKTEILGVPEHLIFEFGAVSEEIVEQMVSGAISRSGANVGVAISGIAGPLGETETKPVGTVCFAWKLDSGILKTTTEHFQGNRNEVRYSSVERALLGTIEFLDNNNFVR